MVGRFNSQLDMELRQTFEDIIGFRVNEAQWDQVALGVKHGGIGMTRGIDITDAEYLASWAATHEDCVNMDSRHVRDNGHARAGERKEFWGKWLLNAALQYDCKAPESCKVSVVPSTGMDKQSGDVLKHNAGDWDRARLEGG